MKCEKCGNEFEGNTCPVCSTKESEGSKEFVQKESISGNNLPEHVENTSTESNTVEYSSDNITSNATKVKRHKAFKITRVVLECILVLLILICFYAISDITKKANQNVKEHNKLVEEYNTLSDEYDSYKEKMKPYEEMEAAEAEAKKVAAEKAVADKKAADEKAAAEKKAAEEKAAADAAAAKAAEEAKGYETGITYDQLARTPDDFMGKKVKFYGKVIQVMENDSSIQIRLAVDDNYDTVLLGEYLPSTVSSRVLEDDYITVYGTSVGTITYESTIGGNITIPGVYIEKIDQ